VFVASAYLARTYGTSRPYPVRLARPIRASAPRCPLVQSVMLPWLPAIEFTQAPLLPPW